MIKKLLIFNIIYIFSAIQAFCFSEYDIDKIEYSTYGEIYETESLSERLSRLENDFFGMAQSGDINSRIAKLYKINSNNKQSAIINPNEYYYPGEKRSAIKNILNNVKSTFSDMGTVTGYTPQIYNSSYGIYNDDFMRHPNNYDRYCPYNYSYGHNGFNNMFQNSNNMANSHLHNHYYNNFHNHNNLPHNKYNPYYHLNNQYGNSINRSYYQTPPNVATRSSVHIIQD